MNQRLQGLVLDSELIHRPWPNGSHTCIAGRGTEARQSSIAYFEGGPGYADLTSRAIFCVGPEHDFDTLQRAMDSELRNFPLSVRLANKLVDTQRRRPILEVPSFQTLRGLLAPTHAAQTELQVKFDTNFGTQATPYETMHWSYPQWLQSGSLNDVQSRVLGSSTPSQHPLRILGPAGSGKSLLLQMLALKHLIAAKKEQRDLRVCTLFTTRRWRKT